jgi:hypothetical protein
MEQQVRQNVQQDKVKKFLDKILEKNPIEVPAPEQISIKAPEIPEGETEGMPGMPPGMQPAPQKGEDAEVAKPAPAQPKTRK